jgi:hypothetical protein
VSYNSENKGAPFAEKLEGTTWTVKELPAPAGTKETDLQGVSCATATACTAVGYFENSAKARVAAVEKLEGTTWTAREPPEPNETVEAELRGVSCADARTCTAVGHFRKGFGRPGAPLVEQNVEATWIAETPANEESGTLHGVSCVAETECMGIGVNWGYEKGLAEKMQAGVWTSQEPPVPAKTVEMELAGVSCTSLSACAAVGWVYSTEAGGRPLAELYR